MFCSIDTHYIKYLHRIDADRLPRYVRDSKRYGAVVDAITRFCLLLRIRTTVPYLLGLT